MYLSLHTAQKQELNIQRLCLFNYNWKLTVGNSKHHDITFINADIIFCKPNLGNVEIATLFGISKEIDFQPFIYYPLDKERIIGKKDIMAFRPGSILIGTKLHPH